jgi:hypothetical protein
MPAYFVKRALSSATAGSSRTCKRTRGSFALANMESRRTSLSRLCEPSSSSTAAMIVKSGRQTRKSTDFCAILLKRDRCALPRGLYASRKREKETWQRTMHSGIASRNRQYKACSGSESGFLARYESTRAEVRLRANNNVEITTTSNKTVSAERRRPGAMRGMREV